MPPGRPPGNHRVDTTAMANAGMANAGDDRTGTREGAVSDRGRELNLATKAWLRVGVRNLDPVPASALSVPLQRARLSLLSTGGATAAGQPPFDTGKRGDPSFRRLASDIDPAELTFDHPHYDTDLAREDPDCVLPVRLLRTLVAEDVVGKLAPSVYSMMGYVPLTRELTEETAPRIGELMQGEGVDAALLCPA